MSNRRVQRAKHPLNKQKRERVGAVPRGKRTRDERAPKHRNRGWE